MFQCEKKCLKLNGKTRCRGLNSFVQEIHTELFLLLLDDVLTAVKSTTGTDNVVLKIYARWKEEGKDEEQEEMKKKINDT